MAEQKDFIEKAFKMGMPAIKNIDMMSKEYNVIVFNFKYDSPITVSLFKGSRKKFS